MRKIKLIFGALLLCGGAAFFTFSINNAESNTYAKGENVYRQHPCPNGQYGIQCIKSSNPAFPPCKVQAPITTCNNGK